MIDYYDKYLNVHFTYKTAGGENGGIWSIPESVLTIAGSLSWCWHCGSVPKMTVGSLGSFFSFPFLETAFI
jgi:hypothetical protein